MPTIVQPDVVAVTIQALLAQPLTATRVGTRVYGRVSGTTFPMWVVSLVDWDENRDAGGIARVQISVWGNGPTEANEFEAFGHARTIAAVSRDLRGTYAAGRVSNSGHLMTVPNPDPDTGRAGYVVDLEIETYPA